MKGTTNSKLTTSLKEIVQLNLITNQNSSSDLVGATISVEYGGEAKNYTWDGNLINIEIPEGWEYTISVEDVSDYKTPSPVTFTSKGNSVTNVDMQYLTELVTITVTTEDGTSANGSVINCNGTNHTYNGVFTKKFAYGTTYTITPSDFGDYSTNPITYTANQVSREISIVYFLGLPAGTTYEFEYTGTVLEITLPRGSYLLQCWGAQGGSVTGTYAEVGLNGGYSEGVLTLDDETTLYVYVGGKGADYTSSDSLTSTSYTAGGWNGGGSGKISKSGSYGGNASYSYNEYYVKWFSRGGGGATDICTVPSDMDEWNGKTTRSSESYLSRCIVAGGGSGAISMYEIKTGPAYEVVATKEITYTSRIEDDPLLDDKYGFEETLLVTPDTYVRLETDPLLYVISIIYITNGKLVDAGTTPCIKIPSDVTEVTIKWYSYYDATSTLLVHEAPIDSSQTDTSRVKYTLEGYGGGVLSGGFFYATQSDSREWGAWSQPGEFGHGMGSGDTGYLTSAGGGAGWYGGGCNADAYYSGALDFLYRDSGGGSGFVNIASNAKYRPTGYTGLELDSGTTIAGNTPFESPTGGTETGHSGNGYARITAL